MGLNLYVIRHFLFSLLQCRGVVSAHLSESPDMWSIMLFLHVTCRGARGWVVTGFGLGIGPRVIGVYNKSSSTMGEAGYHFELRNLPVDKCSGFTIPNRVPWEGTSINPLTWSICSRSPSLSLHLLSLCSSELSCTTVLAPVHLSLFLLSLLGGSITFLPGEPHPCHARVMLPTRPLILGHERGSR